MYGYAVQLNIASEDLPLTIPVFAIACLSLNHDPVPFCIAAGAGGTGTLGCLGSLIMADDLNRKNGSARIPIRENSEIM